MRIGFEAKRATHNKTGLGNYARLIINSLTRYAPSEELFLFTPDLKRKGVVGQILQGPRLKFVLPEGVWATKMLRSIWRSYAMSGSVEGERVDLFHGLSGELPRGIERTGAKSVVTIHDLIFLRYPELYQPVDRWIYERKFRSACRRADHIVAISEMTKRDIVRYFQTDPNKISVLYQGCDDSFKQPVTAEKMEEVRLRYHLPSRFLLSVGTIEKRKNLELVIRALALMKETVPLVVVGRPTPYKSELDRLAGERDLTIVYLTGVPFDDLPALYQSATLFVYPSRFEGFGIPIVEAVHSRLPVIAATGSCLEEAGGEGALYVDPDDDRAMADAIDSLWGDPQACEAMVRKGLEHVRAFEPEQIAKDLMRLYQELVD